MASTARGKRPSPFNKATLCPVTFLTVEPFPNYTFDGPVPVDGKGNENFATGAWMGFASDRAVELLVDLQQPTEVKHISVNTMTYMDAWIMAPTSVTASRLHRRQGVHRCRHQGAPVDTDIHKHCVDTHDFDFDPVNVRYVKLSLQPSPALPVGHAAEGKAPSSSWTKSVVSD
ncbi:MAG: hypothetical protein ACLUVY_05665 [Bacteroides uniformis]